MCLLKTPIGFGLFAIVASCFQHFAHADGAPILFHSSDPVRGGENVVLTGDSLTPGTPIFGRVFEDTDVDHPVPLDFSNEVPSDWTEFSDSKVTLTQNLTAQLVIPSVWGTRTRIFGFKTPTQSQPLLANRPRISWYLAPLGKYIQGNTYDWTHSLDPSAARGSAWPGAHLLLFGRNLMSRPEPGIGIDTVNLKAWILPCAGVVKPETNTCAPNYRATAIPIPVTRDELSYAMQAELPSQLTAGNFALIVHNGYGGDRGFSDPFLLRVSGPKSLVPWKSNVFKVDQPSSWTAGSGATSVDCCSLRTTATEVLACRNLIADPTGVIDSAPAFLAALECAKANGGGVVEVPPGKYLISRTLVIPAKTWLKGKTIHREQTRLQFKNNVTLCKSTSNPLQVKPTKGVIPPELAHSPISYSLACHGAIVGGTPGTDSIGGEFGVSNLTLETATAPFMITCPNVLPIFAKSYNAISAACNNVKLQNLDIRLYTRGVSLSESYLFTTYTDYDGTKKDGYRTCQNTIIEKQMRAYFPARALNFSTQLNVTCAPGNTDCKVNDLDAGDIYWSDLSVFAGPPSKPERDQEWYDSTAWKDCTDVVAADKMDSGNIRRSYGQALHLANGNRTWIRGSKFLSSQGVEFGNTSKTWLDRDQFLGIPSAGLGMNFQRAANRVLFSRSKVSDSTTTLGGNGESAAFDTPYNTEYLGEIASTDQPRVWALIENQAIINGTAADWKKTRFLPNPINPSQLPALDTFKNSALVIVKGKGTGQLRRIIGSQSEFSSQNCGNRKCMKVRTEIDREWDVSPDATSKVVLQVDKSDLVLVGNSFLNGSTVTLYSQAHDAILDTNSGNLFFGFDAGGRDSASNGLNSFVFSYFNTWILNSLENADASIYSDGTLVNELNIGNRNYISPGNNGGRFSPHSFLGLKAATMNQKDQRGLTLLGNVFRRNKLAPAFDPTDPASSVNHGFTLGLLLPSSLCWKYSLSESARLTQQSALAGVGTLIENNQLFYYDTPSEVDRTNPDHPAFNTPAIAIYPGFEGTRVQGNNCWVCPVGSEPSLLNSACQSCNQYEGVFVDLARDTDSRSVYNGLPWLKGTRSPACEKPK